MQVVWDTQRQCHAHGMDLVGLTLDGAEEHRKMLKEFHAASMRKVTGVVSDDDSHGVAIPNAWTGGWTIIMSDDPHLLKKIRNNLYKSGSHEKATRCLEKKRT